ncbi:hypothetical protein Hanom_Chr07g00642561 [Helianthus anomalus]
MLDMYDFNNDIWMCHSFGGRCYNITAYVRSMSLVIYTSNKLDFNNSYYH